MAVIGDKVVASHIREIIGAVYRRFGLPASELVAFDARFRHQCSTRVPRNPKTLHGFRFVLA